VAFALSACRLSLGSEDYKKAIDDNGPLWDTLIHDDIASAELCLSTTAILRTASPLFILLEGLER
jgi:hypothetical protein